jgi:hypothetical protein
MSKTVEATYDGHVFRLSETLDILPDTKVWITVDTVPPNEPQSFLRVARGAHIDGPADWSENLDGYLYGRSTSD